MKSFKREYLWICICTLSFLVHLCSAAPKSTNTKLEVKAYLYEKVDSGKGRIIRYHQQASAWNNIPLLFKVMRIKALEQICVVGPWLIYQEADFVANSVDQVFLLTSLTKKCIKLDEIGGKLGSLQHISPYSNVTRQTLTFFRSQFFEGNAMRVAVADKPVDDEPQPTTYIGSLVALNSRYWTVLMTDNTRLCVESPDSGSSVCFLSNLIDNEHTHPGGVQKVRKGCKKTDKGETVIMQQCFGIDSGLNKLTVSWPFGEPRPKTKDPESRARDEESASESDDKPTTTTNSSRCEIDASKDTIDDELRKLLEARLNGSLNTGNYMSAITNPRNFWKEELFDRSFEVFLQICPPEVIETQYLKLFSSLYKYHLEKLWANDTYMNTSLTDVEWREINHDMRICMTELDNDGFNFIAETTSRELSTYQKFSDLKAKIEKMLGFRPNYDHIMEINWLMANLVVSVCYQSLGHDVNFLPRFLNIYHELYFLPIMNQWSNPGKFKELYPHIFGGYGMEKSLVQIALCTYNTMNAASVVDPYLRPMDQPNPVLLPKVVAG